MRPSENSVPYLSPAELAEATGDHGAIMPLARQMGKLLGCREEIPTIEPIATQQFQFRRKDLWPPHVWAEMEAIRRGDDLTGSGVPSLTSGPGSDAINEETNHGR